MSLFSREQPLWPLVIGFSVILGLMAVLGFIAINTLRTVELNLENIVEVTNEKIAAAHVMRDAIRLRAISLREARLTEDPFVRDDLAIQHSEYAGIFREASKKLTRFGLDEQERILYDRFREIARVSQPLNIKAMQFVRDGKQGSEVSQVFDKAAHFQGKIMGVLGKLIDLELQYAQQAKKDSVIQYESTRDLLIGISLAIILLGIGVALFAMRAVHQGTKQIHFQAKHDALTGLSNRHDFEESLDGAIESAKTFEASHIVLYMDLDNFKIINDSCGHAAGDSLLRDIGRIFRGSVRTSDIVARLGGDEFGVLLMDCEIEFARLIAEKLRSGVEEYRLHWEGDSYSVGICIGLVLVDKSTESRAEVMKHADTACYTAKDEGRNRVHVYIPDDDERELKSRDMHCIGCIRDALEQDGFRLYAQRILPIKEGQQDGLRAEILLRLYKDGEIHLPIEFMPPAERFHMMPLIDRWVLDHVVDWLRKNPDKVAMVHALNINLSGASLNDPQFLDYLDERLSQAGDLAGYLCFEITENIAIRNLEATRKVITRLKQYGCTVALDDFGVGMSSFVYLKTLNIDAVKIDGEFVRNMVNDKVDYGIVRLINEFCHTVGLKTVAEYVESDEIMEQLGDLGVDYAQGNIIMQASPLEDMFKNS